MPGNAFKWVNTQPTQGNFRFTEADQFVAWADARNMPTRLHVLVWHTSLAAWVAGAVNAGTWDDIIDAHIDGVLSHYPARAWDVEVCDEVFDAGESRTATGTRSGTRRRAGRTTSPTPSSAPGSTAARTRSCSSPSSASSRRTARPSATICSRRSRTG